MDRNLLASPFIIIFGVSLSARRAWIEIVWIAKRELETIVALRKESVDRNLVVWAVVRVCELSLSARRAWIEIRRAIRPATGRPSRSPQGERG